jgi:NAD(P)-dependent dehydrogenase (short-subunit alcohol dehydrogenase family)
VDHEEHVAIITGAASGIGRALALALCERGATVVASDIDGAGAEALAAEINKKNGGRAEAVAVDVTDPASVAALVGNGVDKHGRLDFMFNNAGIAVSGDARDLAIEHWKRVIDVNLLGVVYGADAAYKVMAAQRHGHIINIASLAGLTPFPTNAPYSATKHAVVGLSLSMRVEGEALGVRVSVVCPGFIESNIYTSSEAVNVPQEKLLRQIPFKKVPTPVAATKILEGVARNKAIIVFPGYARLIWWLYRLNPHTSAFLGRQMIRDFRKLRQDQGSA